MRIGRDNIGILLVRLEKVEQERDMLRDQHRREIRRNDEMQKIVEEVLRYKKEHEAGNCLIDKDEQMEAMAQDGDKWRNRAERAEYQLSQIHSMFHPYGDDE